VAWIMFSMDKVGLKLKPIRSVHKTQKTTTEENNLPEGEDTFELNLDSLLPEMAPEGDNCIQRLKASLLKQEGILHVHLKGDPASHRLCLHYDPSLISHSQVHRLVEKNSTKIAKRYPNITLPVEGMDCSDCAIVLEHGLSRVRGILMVSVSYTEQQIRVEYDSHEISQRGIKQSIRRMGYDVPKTGLAQFFHEHQALILSLLSGLFLLLAWGGDHFLNLPQPLILSAYALSYLLGGLRLSFHSLRHILRARHLDIDLLMLAAALGAAILGEWAEGAFLLFLFNLGHALEDRAMNRARKAILALADMTPRTAHVLRNGKQEVLPIGEIQLDDLVFIPPGSKIPVDGIVQHGFSSVDLSAITGEAMPVDITESNQVFAGAINGEGALEVRATRLAKDSTLSRIIELVQKAQTQKSPSELISQRITRILVPSILVVDLFLIIFPPLFGVPFKESFLRAMTLLVAASPCALALGTPSAILASLARAARSGVLIKGGAHLENMGNLKAIAFDKTGTITLGTPHVTNVIAFPPFTESKILGWAAAIEQRSAHPLARAVVHAANEKGIELPMPQSVKADTARGIQATLDEGDIWVGKYHVSDDGSEDNLDIRSKIEALEMQGKTAIVVRMNGKIVGILAITDQVRPEAKQTIFELGARGIRHMIMLTGDNIQTAKHIASQVGLNEIQAQLMPEDKLLALKELEKRYQTVAMVGDGVNDAPALAHATVGISMGGAKTQVALETADVVLMADDLSKLPLAIGLGQKTTTIIKQNFFVALGVMTGLIVLTLVNLTGIGLAILLHEGSTLLVILNSLRLLTYQTEA
jgi:Cd2+/Zn2+-exporting ATPase